MTLHYVLAAIGIWPGSSGRLLYVVATVVLWVLFLPFAYLKRVSLMYNASLRVAFWEEFLFRGLTYGALQWLGLPTWKVIIISSLAFGLLHMRNVWWAGWRRSWWQSLYAGFVAGPIFGVVRWWAGDLYPCVFAHFLHNFLVVFAPGPLKRYVADTPRDEELRESGRRKSSL